MTDRIDRKLLELKLTLPEAAAPVAAYVPTVAAGGLLHISGQLPFDDGALMTRSEEHTSELQSLMRISYAVFCLKKKKLIHFTISSINLLYFHICYTLIYILASSHLILLL